MSIICQVSRGRLHTEVEDKSRTPFQRDRDRIIHSGAFRKLEYKTQVFVNHEGDYYRTRLTHSLEVAQITRAICGRLGLNEALGEAIALAHDVGHTPFGHAGEEALDECTKNYGGFDHNAQSIRVVTFLEQRYASFDGMNLTWEVLEGLVKHNGPIPKNKRHKIIAEYNKKYDLELHTFPTAEAQVAAIADDIAYNAHDVDDGLRSQLITLDEIRVIPYIDKSFCYIKSLYPGVALERLIHEMLSSLVAGMINDVINNTRKNLAALGIQTPEDVRQANQPLVTFSEEYQSINRMLKKFLFLNLYRHYKVNRRKCIAKKIVKNLYEYFYSYPECLPTEWQKNIGDLSEDKKVLLICDFIAGMTDRFATKEHQELCGDC